MKLEFNQSYKELSEVIEKLPVNDDMLPLYLNILRSTDSVFIRNELAIKLSDAYPENVDLKNAIVDLINASETNGAKGTLLYSLMSMDYTDKKCIEMLCWQLVEGNYECMHKAFHMLFDIADTFDADSKAYVLEYIEKKGELLGERLDMMEELYNYIDNKSEDDSIS